VLGAPHAREVELPQLPRLASASATIATPAGSVTGRRAVPEAPSAGVTAGRSKLATSQDRTAERALWSLDFLVRTVRNVGCNLVNAAGGDAFLGV
jgi:hypothetical protein